MEQTSNTLDMLPIIMTEKLKAEYQIKTGSELYRAQWGTKKLKAVTSNPSSLEGGRVTFAVLNESHHWLVGNKGKKMKSVIDRNAVKFGGRYMAITNAYQPGEDSVAQDMREDYEGVLEGTQEDSGTLYDSLEATPEASLTGPLVPYILKGVYGDSYWAYPQIPDMVATMRQASSQQSEMRRFWYNQIVALEDALFSPALIDACGPRPGEQRALKPGDAVVMGFDGGLRDDSTAIVIIRISDACAFIHFLSEKPDGPEGEIYEVNRQAVNSAVHEAFRIYNVKAFFCDVELWESYIMDWSDEYGERVQVKSTANKPLEFDMRGNIERTTRANERLVQAVFDKKFRFDGDPRMRRHFLNTFRDDNKYGTSFTKPSRRSRRKNDVYSATVCAYEALVRLKTGKKPKDDKRDGRVFMY